MFFVFSFFGFMFYVFSMYHGTRLCLPSFRAGEAFLDPVHRQLLEHYSARIRSRSSDVRCSTDKMSYGNGSSGGIETTQAARGENRNTESGGESASGAVIAANGGQAGGITEPSAAKAGRLSSFFSPPGSEQSGDEGAVPSSAASSSDPASSGGTDSGSGSDSDSGSGSDSSSSSDEEEGDETEDSGTAESSDGTSSEDSGSSDDSDSSGSEDGEDEQDDLGDEEGPKFEPLVDGVTVGAQTADVGEGRADGGSGGYGGESKEERELSQKKATPEETDPRGRQAAHGRQAPSPGRSSSFSDSLDEYDEQEEEQQDRYSRGASSPPRPVIAGPSAAQVPAILGGERGPGFCAAAAREKLVAARKARAELERDRGTLEGAGETSYMAPPPHVAAKLEHAAGAISSNPGASITAAAETAAIPVASISATKSPVSPSRRPNAAVWGAPTAAAAAAVVPRSQNPPESSASYSGDIVGESTMLPALPPSVLGKLLRTLVAVDAAGRGGADKGSRDGPGSRSPTLAATAGFGGGAATDWSAAGTAGSRRQGRVRAMEDAKRLIAGEAAKVTRGGGGERDHGRGADSAPVSTSAAEPAPPRVGELIGVVLRLTEDPDFKIVRSSNAMITILNGMIASCHKMRAVSLDVIQKGRSRVRAVLWADNRMSSRLVTWRRWRCLVATISLSAPTKPNSFL